MSDPLKNRYEIKFFFDCENGNPNGDPDAGNLPRVDPGDMRGIVTDVALKRRIRNYVQMESGNARPNAIFVEQSTNLNTKIAAAYEANGLAIGGDDPDADTEVEDATVGDKKGKKKGKKTANAGNREAVATARRWLCANFFDVRSFGAVMSTGPNGGQVRGPVQVAIAKSIDPVLTLELTVTRMAVAEDEKGTLRSVADYEAWEAATSENKLRTMGRKAMIPYGLFEGRIFISGFLARQVGFDRDDLATLIRALLGMFEHDRSASKGVMTVRRPIYVFKHVGDATVDAAARDRQAILGRAPAQVLFEQVVTVTRDAEAMAADRCADPRKFSHYKIVVDRDALPRGVELIEIGDDPADLEQL